MLIVVAMGPFLHRALQGRSERFCFQQPHRGLYLLSSAALMFRLRCAGCVLLADMKGLVQRHSTFNFLACMCAVLWGKALIQSLESLELVTMYHAKADLCLKRRAALAHLCACSSLACFW
jgi:hypothetical protein